MHDIATQVKTIVDDDKRKVLKGSIHILMRIIPLLFEDKDLLMRAMWREQALFNN